MGKVVGQLGAATALLLAMGVCLHLNPGPARAKKADTATQAVQEGVRALPRAGATVRKPAVTKKTRATATRTVPITFEYVRARGERRPPASPWKVKARWKFCPSGSPGPATSEFEATLLRKHDSSWTREIPASLNRGNRTQCVYYFSWQVPAGDTVPYASDYYVRIKHTSSGAISHSGLFRMGDK